MLTARWLTTLCTGKMVMNTRNHIVFACWQKHTVSSNPQNLRLSPATANPVYLETHMAVPAILKDNLSIPVIGSPLFIISNPDLVIAQCKAGVIGSFPALNARPEPVLEEWLDRITSELKDHDKNNLTTRQRLSPLTRSSTAQTHASSTIWTCARSTKCLSSSRHSVRSSG